MSIYDDARNVANDLMVEFKQGVVRYVTYASAPGATPDNPGSPVPNVSNPLNTTARPVSTKYVDGSHIVQSDKQVTIPNDGIAVPEMKGFIRIDGVDHKIIELMPTPAAGNPIVWKVIVRR